MFLFYLSMRTDSVLRRARVRIFNALKSQTLVKSYMENPFLFLKIFLFFINYIYGRVTYFISFSTFCFLTNVLQLVDVEILFLLNIKILLYCCGHIKINAGPKQSSLTFSGQWNLMALLLMNLLKFHYCRDIPQNAISTYIFPKPSLILLMTVNMVG